MINTPKKPLPKIEPETPNSIQTGRRSASDSNISQRKKDLAKGRLDNAFRLKIAGDTDGARTSLAEAVRTDPALSNDAATLSLAQALTGLPSDQALLLLLQTSGDAASIQNNRPAFKFSTQQFDTFLWIFGLFIVLLLFSGAMYVSIARLTTIVLDRVKTSPDVTAQASLLFAQTKPAELVRATAQSGIEWLFDLLLGIGAIYVVGTMMGGVGAIGAFTRKMTRAYIILYVLLSVGLILLFGALWQLSAHNSNNANVLSVLGLAVLAISGLGGFFGLAWVVARAHEMNYFKALGAMMIGNFVVGVLAVLLGLFAPSGTSSTTPDFSNNAALQGSGITSDMITPVR